MRWRRRSSDFDRTPRADRPRACLCDRKREPSTERQSLEHERFSRRPRSFLELAASETAIRARIAFASFRVWSTAATWAAWSKIVWLTTDPRRVRWLRETVTGLSERNGSVTLRFSAAEPAMFDMAVLCCGHEASETLDAPFVSPWEDPRSWNTAPNSTILILGTGLTMVDAAIALSESGHRGPIVALSRRGLLPQAHRRVEPRPITETELPSPQGSPLF